ncbi:hypothetical protein DRN84_02510 [Candidatus Geothermarchaeota archaeon]|nr:MAG: hypothetical protein DRN84_02510 [Candidatus Geothermarchaeota archaeon]
MYPKGHDLVKLYNIIKEELALEIDISLLPRLSAYYVQTRYPNAGIERPSIEFNKLIAEEALNISEMIINEVSKALKDP